MGKLEINNKGTCPICGIYGRLTRHGLCSKCMTVINYDNIDLDVKESENDFWGDAYYST